MATMFDRYGGFTSVSKIVMSFYDKVLDSETVGPYFEDIDMKALIDHQTKFIAQVMGGQWNIPMKCFNLSTQSTILMQQLSCGGVQFIKRDS